MKSKQNPKYTKAARMGELGVNLVADLISNELGWIFRRTHQEHDFGIDGYIDLVADDGTVTGRQLAVQIKCGESYLREIEQGFLRYNGKERHLNYLLNHPMPVLLLVCDPDTKSIFWQHFSHDELSLENSGWAIEIPKRNVLSIQSKLALVEIAGPSFDKASELANYWRLNKLLEQTSNILFTIGREAIEIKRMEGVQEFFRRLCLNPKSVRANQNKVTLAVYGYDDDPRELFEVPEVRGWFKAAESIVKHWVYFLVVSGENNSLRLLTCCICEAKVLKRTQQADGKTKLEIELNKVLAIDFMKRHFEWLNEITEQFQLDDKVNFEISLNIMRALGIPDELI